MKYKILGEIGIALMRARWKQTFVAAIGVSFSIAMFIALLGFMTGLNTLLDGIMLNRTPHIRIYNDINPSAVQPLQRIAEYKDSYLFLHSIQSNANRGEIYNAGPILETLQIFSPTSTPRREAKPLPKNRLLLTMSKSSGLPVPI